MRNLRPSDVNKDYEPHWKRTSFGMFNREKTEIYRGINLDKCCEKCVFNSGVHAQFCAKLKSQVGSTGHGSADERGIERKD